MSRTTVHAYVEAFGGATLSEDTKDLHLNLTRLLVLSALRPWGASHIQTNMSVDYINSVAKTDYVQTEYSYPSTNVPMEIAAVSVKYATSASYKTARCVQPFEDGDDCAENYNNQEDPIYFLRNNKIIIYPQFTSVITSAIKVTMIQRLSEISASVTTTGFSAEGEKLWALKALVSYFSSIGDKKMAAKEAEYQEYLWALKKIAPIGAVNEV